MTFAEELAKQATEANTSAVGISQPQIDRIKLEMTNAAARGAFSVVVTTDQLVARDARPVDIGAVCTYIRDTLGAYVEHRGDRHAGGKSELHISWGPRRSTPRFGSDM